MMETCRTRPAYSAPLMIRFVRQSCLSEGKIGARRVREAVRDPEPEGSREEEWTG
jgi:hypothetical protein